MSFDLVVWHSAVPISDEQATELYQAICEGEEVELTPHKAVDEFCTEFTAAYPDVGLEPSNACALVSIAIGHERADEIEDWIWANAGAKGLSVFDPQTSYLHQPDAVGEFSRPRPGHTRIGKLLGPVFALILLTVSARGAWWVGTDVMMMSDGHSWQTAEAMIESSGIGLTRSLNVTYSFSVGGQVYLGNRFRIPSSKPSRREAESIIAALPAGSKTTVFYDPENPTRNAITRPNFQWGFALSMAGGSLLFFLAGSYVLWRSLRNR